MTPVTRNPESTALSGPPEPLHVGPRLRELRRQSSLTLEAAAHRICLSPAYLSRIETGKRQPPMHVLLALARTYGTTVADLLGETVPERHQILRADQAQQATVGGWTYWTISDPGRALQVLRLELPGPAKGRGTSQSVQEARKHQGEEWLRVERGQMQLTLGDGVHLLGEGDVAHFDSSTPHRVVAVSRGGAELLFMHTLLQSSAAELCLGNVVSAHSV